MSEFEWVRSERFRNSRKKKHSLHCSAFGGGGIVLTVFRLSLMRCLITCAAYVNNAATIAVIPSDISQSLLSILHSANFSFLSSEHSYQLNDIAPRRIPPEGRFFIRASTAVPAMFPEARNQPCRCVHSEPHIYASFPVLPRYKQLQRHIFFCGYHATTTNEPDQARFAQNR